MQLNVSSSPRIEENEAVRSRLPSAAASCREQQAPAAERSRSCSEAQGEKGAFNGGEEPEEARGKSREDEQTRTRLLPCLIFPWSQLIWVESVSGRSDVCVCVTADLCV